MPYFVVAAADEGGKISVCDIELVVAGLGGGELKAELTELGEDVDLEVG